MMGMGSWAAQALDGLLKWKLVSRREEVSEFIGREGFPNKPVLGSFRLRPGQTRMPKEVDIGFTPSGNWLTFVGVPLTYQPPDVLMQLIEYFFVLNGVMQVNEQADVRPAPVLLAELLAGLGEIKAGRWSGMTRRSSWDAACSGGHARRLIELRFCGASMRLTSAETKRPVSRRVTR